MLFNIDFDIGIGIDFDFDFDFDFDLFSGTKSNQTKQRVNE
jgi:hypothetical protein